MTDTIYIVEFRRLKPLPGSTKPPSTDWKLQGWHNTLAEAEGQKAMLETNAWEPDGKPVLEARIAIYDRR